MRMKIQSLGNTALPATSKASTQTTTSFAQVLNSKSVEKTKADPDEVIYDELASKYDIRNATFEEVKEIGHALYEAGAMTLKQLMMLTFDYDRATEYIKIAASGKALPNFTMYETAADKEGKRDWIAEFAARAAKDRQYGNLIGSAAKQEILSILQLL